LRARAVADDGARLYYEVHGLSEPRRRALQRRAGHVPRPACWSAAGFFSQSSGGAAVALDGRDDNNGGNGAAWRPSSPPVDEDREQHDEAAAAPLLDDDEHADPRPRVLLIMGLACGASAWRWTIPDLVAPLQQQQQGQEGGAAADLAPMVVAALDNRGSGSSDAPRERERYSTDIMASDARRVLEDLGWWRRRRPQQQDVPGSLPPPPPARPVHIVGFSMGGMIATKLAASVALDPDPSRHAVASLTVLSTSGGGVETIPWRSLRGLRTAACIALARSPEAAAEATLGMHFARRTLRAPVPPHLHDETAAAASGGNGDGGGPLRRFELLRREYLVRSSSSQPAHGFGGQLRACWNHRFTELEARAIRRSHFPTLVLHGRRDLLADPSLGERLARRLRCPSVFLEGAHFIVRECAAQTNALLVAVALSEHVAGGGGHAKAQADIVDGRAVAAMSAAAAAAGLPRFARAPREAQATWHLEPSPVVRAMWSGRVATPVPAPEGGGGRAGAGDGSSPGAAAKKEHEGGSPPRVTVRAL
jgi:pimeloyl-ACP methyl ester carboxylesterase